MSIYLRFTCIVRIFSLLIFTVIVGNAGIPHHITINPSGWLFWKKLSLQSPYSLDNPYYLQSPTLAYTTIPEFNPIILASNIKPNIKDSIFDIGPKVVERIINRCIENELTFAAQNCVSLVHGQAREFIIFYELFSYLYELKNNTTLNDFVFLRIPTSDFDHYKTLHEFFTDHPLCKKFDNNNEVSKYLLSVNPSLFGNSHRSSTRLIAECSFKHFIQSVNYLPHNVEGLIADAFAFFDLSALYQTVKPHIIELISLLSAYEHGKTGCLVHIGLPMGMADRLTYRCIKQGIPFYNIPDIATQIDLSNRPPLVPTSQFLTMYPQKIAASLKDNTMTLKNKITEFDEPQFRILITNEILNPTSGVHITFYTNNRTNNMRTYHKKMKILKEQIKLYLQLQTSE